MGGVVLVRELGWTYHVVLVVLKFLTEEVLTLDWLGRTQERVLVIFVFLRQGRVNTR
jgi:hypothetical protein